MTDLTGKRIAVIGLGYVGLPLAVEFAKAQDVVGFDLNAERVEALRGGFDSTLEITPEGLAAAEHLSFSTQLEDIKDCDVYIVTVPTPIDSVKRPDLSPLQGASQAVGSVLSKGDVVIYESTVYPGCTEEVCVPILEQASGLTFNTDFFCGYSPERINPGDKVNTLTTIIKVTSGSTPETAAAVDALYGSIVEAGTFPASSIKVAEAAKVIENTQRDINIALVNELSVIFNRLEIDTLDVLEAAGSKWNFLPFRPGMVGGHCIGVDPYYLTHKAEEVGYNPQVILAGRRINDNMGRYAARNMIKMMSQNGTNVSASRVAVLGVTFKENCPDIRNSKIIDLIRELQAWGVEVVVADAWADADEVAGEYGVTLVSQEDIKDVDAIAVAVAHQEYSTLSPDTLRAMCRSDKPVLGDMKSVFDRVALADAGFTVFRF
jgi:UDP-N-acetyl-D-galactosamine dehydrogenase